MTLLCWIITLIISVYKIDLQAFAMYTTDPISKSVFKVDKENQLTNLELTFCNFEKIPRSTEIFYIGDEKDGFRAKKYLNFVKVDEKNVGIGLFDRKANINEVLLVPVNNKPATLHSFDVNLKIQEKLSIHYSTSKGNKENLSKQTYQAVNHWTRFKNLIHCSIHTFSNQGDVWYVTKVNLAQGNKFLAKFGEDAGIASNLANQLNDRIFIWTNSIGMLKDNKLFGVGLYCWPTAYSLYRIIGAKNEYFMHNEPFQVFCELGIIGSFFYFSLFFSVGILFFWNLGQLSVLCKFIFFGLVLLAVTAFFDFPLACFSIQVLAMYSVSFVIANILNMDISLIKN